MSSLFSDVELPPLMNGAGTIKTIDQALALVGAPVPAVLAGSFTLEERPGNAGRTFYEGRLGALNSMGLPGPSRDVWTGWIGEMQQALHADGKDLWVSVAGFNPGEYKVLVESALEAGADRVEMNLGCPNIWHEGEQKPIVSYSVEQTELVLEQVNDALSTGRVGVKLSPILDGALLAEVDRALRNAGVAFVVAVNTVPNCLALDDRREAAISAGGGLAGMSGAGIKWLGCGQVVQHREQLPDTPIVGVGGIVSGSDFAEYLSPSVGASACQVATAYWQRGPRCLTEILEEFVDDIVTAPEITRHGQDQAE